VTFLVAILLLFTQNQPRSFQIDCGGIQFDLVSKPSAKNPLHIVCRTTGLTPEFQYILQMGGNPSARYVVKKNAISIVIVEPGSYWVQAVASDGQSILSAFQKFEVKKGAPPK